MTIKYSDLKIEGSHTISLCDLIGKEIKDIQGYLTNEFGEPVFRVSTLIFEDGTSMMFEGEHDCPYLVDGYKGNQPNYDQETLIRIYKEYLKDGQT